MIQLSLAEELLDFESLASLQYRLELTAFDKNLPRQ